MQAPQFSSAKSLCHAHALSITLYYSDLLVLSSLTSMRGTRELIGFRPTGSEFQFVFLNTYTPHQRSFTSNKETHYPQ